MRVCLTNFDLVGTVGMEGGSSHSFVPFQPVVSDVKQVNSGQVTLTENFATDFCGGIVQLDSS